MLSQKLKRRRSVFNGLGLISLSIKLDGFTPVIAFVSELDTGLGAPEQIRNKRDKPMRCIPVSNLAHEAVDTKDFLEHDDARSITARRQCKVAVELAAIERFDLDHSSDNSHRSHGSHGKILGFNPRHLWTSFPGPIFSPLRTRSGSCTCGS